MLIALAWKIFRGIKMKRKDYLAYLRNEEASLHETGLFKHEHIMLSPQSAEVRLQEGNDVINLCANNYLGLANHPDIVRAAREALESHGYGMSSVRFICGTQTIHKQLEDKLSQFLGTDDTILYSSCFDANGGLFETLLTADDAVISDELNHASIIDGIRLCKAKRYRYHNNDMNDLETQLKAASGARVKLIATDGVFSMDGIIANLRGICDLADKYDALVLVDDSHAVGVLGQHGRGTPEYHDVMQRVDIITGTLGKALGGASGGYTSARKEIVAWLRQRSRPYLFSNSLAPMIVATSITVLDMLAASQHLRQQLLDNARFFRKEMISLGFNLVDGDHPIVPIMLGDAKLATHMANALLQHGVYAVSFSYPVVPEGKARIRTQLSAAHTKEQLSRAINAFAVVGRESGVI